MGPNYGPPPLKKPLRPITRAGPNPNFRAHSDRALYASWHKTLTIYGGRVTQEPMSLPAATATKTCPFCLTETVPVKAREKNAQKAITKACDGIRLWAKMAAPYKFERRRQDNSDVAAATSVHTGFQSDSWTEKSRHTGGWAMGHTANRFVITYCENIGNHPRITKKALPRLSV